MSIYATNFIVTENGESKLIKHLNKLRIHRFTLRGRIGGWNKSGKSARENKRWECGWKKEKYQELKKILENFDND